jgi:DNA repair exonuclease SbcCD ATPase subunit
MNNIRIKELKLVNFKKHAHLVLALDGKDASIFGDNATGKSSIYDALTWIMFGKDSRGNGEKNFEVKPLGLDGEVKDHDAITEVEVTFMTDDGEISLRRTLREIWATKRGCSTPVFDGNTSEYFIDGVPVKKYAFSEKVSELVDEEVFKLLTSVSHFADSISWQERREVLFKAAGVASDREIMAMDARFAPLLEAMGKLELEDYKKKIVAEKRSHAGNKDEIPARISECERTIADIRGIDFESIRAEVDKLAAEADAVNAEIIASEHDSAAEGKRLEIREAQLSLDALEAENKAYRASQAVGTANISKLTENLTDLTHLQAQKESRITMYAGQITAYDKEIAASRERWIAVNSEKFSASLCPTCGQALPASQLKAAQDSFEAQKAKRLREIEQTANARKEARGQTEERLSELHEELNKVTRDISDLKGQIDAAKANKIEVIDLADYSSKKAQLTHDIAMLQGELADMMTGKGELKGKLARRLSEIRAEISRKREELGRESLLEYSKQRIEQLKEDARRASELLEGIEGMLYLIDEYSRYKTQFVEDSVNGLFRIARFRLFREQANGGLEDRCDVVYDGIPYANLNSGARINVGIDIINTLSVIYGVKVPLFIDNAESVTALEPCASQTIRLIVSENDKELRVTTI